ncbi:MAG: 2-oxoacid:acceptor oxidoreductase family protein [Candidatus Competibacteraceae bacterium]
MYRIRFTGVVAKRMKTASRSWARRFFWQVSRSRMRLYGAERRGAPIFAYVRAGRSPIQERGIIRQPDLVVVADDTLLNVPPPRHDRCR